MYISNLDKYVKTKSLQLLLSRGGLNSLWIFSINLIKKNLHDQLIGLPFSFSVTCDSFYDWLLANITWYSCLLRLDYQPERAAGRDQLTSQNFLSLIDMEIPDYFVFNHQCTVNIMKKASYSWLFPWRTPPPHTQSIRIFCSWPIMT